MSWESGAEYTPGYLERQILTFVRGTRPRWLASWTKMFNFVSGLSEDGIEVRQHVRRVPLLEADEFAGDLAVTVDDVRFWVHRGAVRFRYRGMIVFGGRIAISRERYTLIAQKFFIFSGI